VYGQTCIYDDIPCVSTMYCKLLLWAGNLSNILKYYKVNNEILLCIFSTN